MKKSNILPSIVLGAICLVVAILLSVVNMFTAPVIAERQAAAASAALQEVLPNGSNFQELEITADYPAVVVKGWKADGGSVFQMEVKGYQSGLIIMCGIDADGKIAGVKHIASNETFNAEGELNGAYTAKQDNLDSLEMILSTSASKGAPMTSQAYYDALKAALQSAILASGGSVDTRTPEQILQDDCNAALGTTGLTFTKWFATEVIEGVDKVYESEAGKVYVIGESFVGIKADGTIIPNGASDEIQAKVNEANVIIEESTVTEITDFDGLSEDIVSVSVTNSGNYIIVANGDGFGIKGNKYYNPSKKPITVKVCISADGAIISTLTVEEYETPDVGGIVANDPDFYEQFNGKTDETYTSVENISSTTLTCNGYKDAIKAAFTAFELLTTTEGGND